MHDDPYNGVGYKDLARLLAEKKDWATRVLIIDVNLSDRPALLEKVFLQAANQHDDKEALEYLNYIMYSLRDIELFPLTTPNESKTTRHLPLNKETREATSRAQANCAAKAIELWGKVPRYKEYKQLGREPVLLQTKKSLLDDVANRWQDTKDEEEAINLFEFLIFIKPEYKEEELLLKVIREATDSHFPVKRLFGCLRRLASNYGGYELQKILAIAWARNMDFKELAKIARATEPLFGAPDSAFDLLERQANKVATLDRAVSKLLESMDGRIKIEGLDHVFGEKIVSYYNENYVEIVIINKDDSYDFRFFDKTAGHGRFEAARKHVDYWLNEHFDYSIHLKFMIVNKHDPKDCLFSREQKIIKIR